MDYQILLEKFSQRLKKRRIRLHGCVLMLNGETVGELYVPPYNRDTPHRMYSATKSVVAVAIGKLIGEGKLSLDDKPAELFFDIIDTSETHPFVKELTVRNALMMQTAYSRPTYGEGNKDWLASYFRATPTHPPATLWHYDSCGSYMLGGLVKHISGMSLREYMRPLFDEIGVSRDAYFLEGPDGEAWAGSGFIATTSDIAKIANLLLNKGRANGKQLIPEDYAIDATSTLTRAVDGSDANYYRCGYGYQIWTLPEGAFAFKGLGGQLAIGFPGRNLVFACNSDTAAADTTYNELLDAMYDIILPHFPITDMSEYERTQCAPITENVFEDICNKDYDLNENPTKITSVRFEKSGDLYYFIYTRNGETKRLEFKINEEHVTLFPEQYSGKRLFDPSMKMNYKCSVIGEWTEPTKLRICVYAEDIFVGNMLMFFAFRDGKVAIQMKKNAQFFFDNFPAYTYGTAEEEK